MSTKAILDKQSNLCKGKASLFTGKFTHTHSANSLSITSLCVCVFWYSGYGFVDFESPVDALKAVQSLQATGVLAQFAKVPQVLLHPTW